MDLNTFRRQTREHDPLAATYWRRRFLALVVGLAILAVIAWALSGVAAGGAAAGSGASTPLAAGAAPVAAETPGPGGVTASPHPKASGNAIAAGTAGSGGTTGPGNTTETGSAGGSRPGTVTPGGTLPDASAAAGGAAQPRGPGAAPAEAAARLRACQPGDLVISLYAGRGGYGPRQAPGFDVAFVSTAARPCAVNVGPKFLALIVTAHGQRVWGSADCVAGRGSLLAGLARGVPEIVPLSWDRQTSAPGCAQEARRAPGRYAAAASDGGVTSNSVTFRVR